MQFFKRILQPRDPALPTPEERRRSERFPVGREFPLKCSLSFVGRDEKGQLLSTQRTGWNWRGRLLNCSEDGARMQFEGAIFAAAGDACDLNLTLEDFDLAVPCRIANISENRDGVAFGLQHAIRDEKTWTAYWQFLEIVALGSTLRPQFEKPKRDAGYLLEQYASERPSQLKVWRFRANKAIAAFEFFLKDSLVRAVAGQHPEYFSGANPAAVEKATPARSTEIHRLFRWVVPNLSSKVPPDVRRFLHDRVI